ncbi:paired amphipathic helix protein Sin3a [Rhodotorula toruloides]|uniref:Paired amphipathic helix protein Sin3a n=1 Tax=Rhodotorula toruloides TaxID=5286 RepID=A0A511K9J0_RHOTO|nr:paired amphipathic helix protein Sin3a [Rhodotorula toruloides]
MAQSPQGQPAPPQPAPPAHHAPPTHASSQSAQQRQPAFQGQGQRAQQPIQPGQQPPPPTQAQQQQAAFRPLNVRDALHYLDRVKQQFANEYVVYDQFLTIMKDFKTQNIDTPGVIDRVSTLFRDHPSLIQGFNTFLPPGYRIECHVTPSADAGAPGSAGGNTNTITVTTPMGVTTRTQNVSASTPLSSGPPPPQPPAVSTSAASQAAPAPSTAKPAGQNLPQARLPPLPPGQTSQAARAISPPAPIPPFGGNRTAWNATTSTQPQQAKTGQKPGGVAGPSSGSFVAHQPALATRAGPATQAPKPTAGSAAYDVKPNLASESPVPSAVTQQQHAPAVAPPAPVAPTPAPTQQAAQPPSGPPQVMEFNHAINYVNKIKNRFAKEPETYKTFLEILQTYQKDQRPIQEVYAQVTILFHKAPDLLEEFKAFLPDTSAPENAAGASPAGPAGTKKDVGAKAGATMGGKGVAAPVPGEKKKRAAPGTSEKAKAKRAKMAHLQQQQQQQAASIESPLLGHGSSVQVAKAQQQHHADFAAQHSPVSPHGPPPPAAQPHAHPYGAPPPGFPGAPRMQSAYDAYLAQHQNPPLVQPEEFTFFERVKKHIDDREAYTEFLKLLNLYTQEIIDLRTLLAKCLLFIGNDDTLVAQFKDLVGWDPVKDGRVDGEDWIIDNEPVLERPRVELHLLKSFGPSYRKLPDSEIDLACSGRGPLEWSVLNDEWVAFATWASEGSGAHRKNPYEEALYNSEQERHWYSFHLESMARTVSHFETIAARLALMSSDERANFKLGGEEGGLGGTAPSVYERIVRKIYGKDHGWEILQALEDNPAVAVPIVLARLKQKDEEWKRAEREWNKVWREVDAKNFYRALDHQGIPFKAIDKKTTTTSKSLTTEIETLRRDKQQKRFDIPDHQPPRHPSHPTGAITYPTDSISPSLPLPLRPLHQFEMHMSDRSVLFDVLKLTFSYLDREQSGFSTPERARLEAFLRLFVPLLWGVSIGEQEANLGQSQHDDDADEDEAETEAGDVTTETEGETGAEGSEAGSSSVGGGRKGSSMRRGGAADLRKRLLMHAAATADRSVPAAANGKSASRQGSPASDECELGRLADATWIQLVETKENGEPVSPPSPDEVLNPRRYNFFANSTVYCLVRVLHAMYHRLLAFKQLAADLASAHRDKRLNPIGVDLGLSAPVPVVDTGDNPPEHYYEHMLELAEKLFDGEIDQQTYEEQLRYMAGVRAYPLFTLDKLISTAIKHIHTINSENRCQDIVTLLEKDRARQTTTPRQQIAYRMEVEQVLGTDEHIYRIEWIPASQALTIQLLGKEDLTMDDAYESEAKMHQSWLASFALTSPSEGIGAQVKAPLLKRNRVLSASEDPQEFDLLPGLEAKVFGSGYKLFFVANTEDFLRRRRPPPEGDEADARVDGSLAQRRSERFHRWLEEQLHPATVEQAKEGGAPDAPSAAEAAVAAPDDSASGAAGVEAGEDVQMVDEQQ